MTNIKNLLQNLELQKDIKKLIDFLSRLISTIMHQNLTNNSPITQVVSQEGLTSEILSAVEDLTKILNTFQILLEIDCQDK